MFKGRFHFTDGPPRRCATKDGAKKTLVCKFEGEHFIAERIGAELLVFSITDDDLVPARLEQTWDSKSPPPATSVAGLEARNRAFWSQS